MKLAKFSEIKSQESTLFDALRAISAILVFVGHIYQIFIMPHIENIVITRFFFVLAGYSVMIFFVISGYMICVSIYKNISDHDFSYFDAYKFSINRLIRLYPPLIFAFIVCLIVVFIGNILYFYSGFFNGKFQTNAISNFDVSLFASLFFIQNMFRDIFPPPNINFPLWSLSFEFWFYAIAALVVIGVVNKRIYAWLALVIFGTVMFFFGKWQDFSLGFLVWLSGFMLAGICQNFKQPKGLVRNILRSIAFLTGVLWVASIVRLIEFPHFEAKYAFGIFFSFAFVAFIITFQKISECIYEFSAVKKISKLSSFSFTLYIIHYPIIILLYALSKQFIGGGLMADSLLSLPVFIVIFFFAKVTGSIVENKKYFRGVIEKFSWAKVN